MVLRDEAHVGMDRRAKIYTAVERVRPSDRFGAGANQTYLYAGELLTTARSSSEGTATMLSMP